MSFIGVALLGFILTDFSFKQSTNVAEINGESFEAEDYRNKEQVLRNFYKLNYGENLDPQIEQQVQDETWSRLVRQTIMTKSYNNLGIDVSTDELKSMVAGDQSGGLNGFSSAFSEPHPIVKQMFTNPETGEFNQYIMINYFNSLGSEEYAQENQRWVFIENEIIDERLNQKYLTLISKGLRPSSLEVKDHYLVNEKKVDFNFVSKNFSSVTDEEISFTEADLKAYYKENHESYKQNESRSIEYVVFDVVSSDNDDKNAKLWTQQTKAEFSRLEEDRVISYVNSVSDEPYDSRYYTSDEVNPILKDSLLNQSNDYIYGPYYENHSYKLSKNKASQMRPDSVRARHILIGYAVVGDVRRAKEIADSLKTVIEEGADFNLIAGQYSTDERNRGIGGDLGWFREGSMGQGLNDACFENKTGDLLVASTNLGAHIIKIESQSKPVSKVQIATIVHNVIASNETDQEYYNRAVKFRAKSTSKEKFDEQAIEYGLDPRIVPGISKDQRKIDGLENPVSIISWTFSSEQNDVSNIFDVEDKYIVATVTEVKEQGYADFEDVKNEVELEVKKQKKAEVLMADMQSKLSESNELSSFATSENLSISEAQVRFANAYVENSGLEPYIVGASMFLPVDQISGPFIGENGVMVLDVTNREEPMEDVNADMSASLSRLVYSMQSRSNFEAYNALVEEANVVDNRLTIFHTSR